MSWRELLNFIEPLLPFLGIAAIFVALAVLYFAVTGGMAALEIGRYYRRKNALLEEAGRREALAVTETELRKSLQGAVAAAVAPLREDLIEVRAELDRTPRRALPEQERPKLEG